VGRIRAGEYAGSLIFAHPETVPFQWTFYIEPSPNPAVPGDMYAYGNDYVLGRFEDWQVEWLEPGDEEVAFEQDHFGLRKYLNRRRTLFGRRKNLKPIPTLWLPVEESAEDFTCEGDVQAVLGEVRLRFGDRVRLLELHAGEPLNAADGTVVTFEPINEFSEAIRLTPEMYFVKVQGLRGTGLTQVLMSTGDDSRRRALARVVEDLAQFGAVEVRRRWWRRRVRFPTSEAERQSLLAGNEGEVLRDWQPW
jgi:hypothetical protein